MQSCNARDKPNTCCWCGKGLSHNARRNARARVLAALRAVRATLDRECPALTTRKGRKRLTPQGRVQRLKRAGWVRVWPADAAKYAAQGVRVRELPETEQRFPTYWVPAWAAAVGTEHPSWLREAIRSRAVRQAHLAAAQLRGGS